MEEEILNKSKLFDSWTLVNPSQKEDRIEPEVHQSAEDSDGISIISESEFGKTAMSGNESECDEEKPDVHEDVASKTFQMPPTPLSTLKINDVMEDYLNEPLRCEKVFLSKNFIFGAGFFIVVAFFYSHVSQLRLEIAKCSNRITQLEAENQFLKNGLKRFEQNLVRTPLQDDLIEKPTAHLNVIHPSKAPEPQTQTVWVGNEKEEMVEILDKKNDLPDFCFFTQEGDLFYEHNQKVCGEKKRKLERTEDKRRMRMQKQKAFSYDEYIAETLKSLKGEIQVIKSKRENLNEKLLDAVAVENTDFDILDESTNNFQEQRQSKKKRLRKDKNWDEKRRSGREAARRKNQKHDNNKRKNERDLD